MTATGKHQDEPDAAAERYGRHSQAHARGSSVAELLRRIIARGEAVRLAWRDVQANALVDDREEFPTAVLPALPIEDHHDTGNDATEPTTVTREARRSLWSGGVARWPLAG